MDGVLSAIKLREAGIDDVTVYEKADPIGGTWRENTYPGVACDVPSHLYRYSFAANPDWTHVFSPGGEILDYLEDVAERHGVTEVVRFGAEVTRLEWAGGRWNLELAGGGRDHADFVIAATGVLHHPRHPDIEGLGDFAGACFHSACWDHDVALGGARVGIVGTGSTAVQITSAVVSEVAHLCLFQRTAQWVLAVPNDPIDDAQRAEYRRNPSAYMAVAVPGLPNLFMINGPNGPVGNFSLIDVAEAQIAYILQLIEAVRQRGCRDVMVTHEAARRCHIPCWLTTPSGPEPRSRRVP